MGRWTDWFYVWSSLGTVGQQPLSAKEILESLDSYAAADPLGHEALTDLILSATTSSRIDDRCFAPWTESTHGGTITSQATWMLSLPSTHTKEAVRVSVSARGTVTVTHWLSRYDSDWILQTQTTQQRQLVHTGLDVKARLHQAHQTLRYHKKP
jgi:hypothetical protein